MKLIISILLIIITTGCSSILSKSHKGFGHPYEGSKVSVDTALCLNVISLLLFPPAVLVTLPVSIFDVATTAVTETVFLPADLLVIPEKDKYYGSPPYLNCNGFWGR